MTGAEAGFDYASQMQKGNAVTRAALQLHGVYTPSVSPISTQPSTSPQGELARQCFACNLLHVSLTALQEHD